MKNIYVLLDTNVLLDEITRREPFYDNAANIISLAKLGRFTALVSASAITDMYYIACKDLKDKTLVMSRLKALLKTVEIAAVTGAEIHRAINLDWADFEDCVQYTAGESLAVSYIITRDPEGFAASGIPVVSPEKFLAMITID
ncbi:twitching motility protein PilT [Spirochaetia bacterium]|nr:twitching motility protein PilT [Spirochaetia bacterium]